MMFINKFINFKVLFIFNVFEIYQFGKNEIYYTRMVECDVD